jgi:hypothetical protein
MKSAEESKSHKNPPDVSMDETARCVCVCVCVLVLFKVKGKGKVVPMPSF